MTYQPKVSTRHLQVLWDPGSWLGPTFSFWRWSGLDFSFQSLLVLVSPSDVASLLVTQPPTVPFQPLFTLQVSIHFPDKTESLVIQTPSSGIRMLWMRWTNSHGLQKSCGEKGMTQPLWVRERLDPCLDKLYCFLIASHQRRFSFIMLRFVLGDYFLQITKERMLLITSYCLTKKKCCKCKGMIRVIGRVTLRPWEISTDFRKLL